VALNTVLFKTIDGTPLYETETHLLVDRRTTVLRRVDKELDEKLEVGEVAAELHWGTESGKPSTLQYLDEEIRTAEFLVKSRIIRR